MSSVNVDIQAKTAQPRKELQDFGNFLGRIAKVWENVMGGKGSRQASSNLQQLSKGVDQLGKAAEKANVRLQSINTTLGQVTAQRKALEGTTGSVLLKDKDIYKSLADQEKSLSRQQRTWSTIAAIRNRMAANAPQTGGGTGGTGGAGGNNRNLLGALGGGLFNRATGGLTGAAGGLVGNGGVGAIMEGLGPVLGAVVLASVGLAVKGFGAAMKQDESLVGFLPRMRPGGMGSTNVTGLARRMRGVGRPLAFNAEESIAAFQAMSEGGGNFGHGLERDTKSSMQFARMFGLDAGGVASMNATAQRMGAFKAGDAKKFASMLATEIARTGLGPRAQEVQEATLMLLNRQMQDQAGANPGPVMALQTILNKTGIPAFQGTAGAGFINQLQDAITNPGDEGSQALNFAVARRMGAKTLYQTQMIQAQGLNNPKFLPTLMGMINEGAQGNPEKQEMALAQYFKQPLTKIHALRVGLGGSFTGLTAARLKATIGGLQGQEGFLDKGAKTTTDAFNSLAIKQAQIVIHEATLRVGENVLPKVAGVARDFAKSGDKFVGEYDSNDPTMKKIGTMADAAMGRKPGTTKVDFSSTANVVKSIAGMVLNPKVFRPGVNPLTKIKDDFLHDLAHGLDFSFTVGPHTHFEGMKTGPAAGLLGAMQDMRKAGLHPTITSAFRTRAEQERARRRRAMGLSPYPAARPGFSAHENGTAVDISVPPGERDQVTAIMAAHGFDHNVPGDPVHYSIHIHDHTSDHRAKRLVKEAIKEHHDDTTRSKVNTRNKRR